MDKMDKCASVIVCVCVTQSERLKGLTHWQFGYSNTFKDFSLFSHVETCKWTFPYLNNSDTFIVTHKQKKKNENN